MSEIKPALSAEEWVPRAHGLRAYIDSGDAELWLDGRLSFGMEYNINYPHALAALCLHGQEYGFSWEDVDALRDSCDDLPIDRGPHPLEARLRDLADRIAALLPPRPPEQKGSV